MKRSLFFESSGDSGQSEKTVFHSAEDWGAPTAPLSPEEEVGSDGSESGVLYPQLFQEADVQESLPPRQIMTPSAPPSPTESTDDESRAIDVGDTIEANTTNELTEQSEVLQRIKEATDEYLNSWGDKSSESERAAKQVQKWISANHQFGYVVVLSVLRRFLDKKLAAIELGKGRQKGLGQFAEVVKPLFLELFTFMEEQGVTPTDSSRGVKERLEGFQQQSSLGTEPSETEDGKSEVEERPSESDKVLQKANEVAKSYLGSVAIKSKQSKATANGVRTIIGENGPNVQQQLLRTLEAHLEVKIAKGSDPGGFSRRMIPVFLELFSLVESEDGTSLTEADRSLRTKIHQYILSSLENKSHRSNVMEMVRNGLDPNITDNLGRTILHHLVGNFTVKLYSHYNRYNIETLYRDEIIELLAEYRANPNQPDRLGNTPFTQCLNCINDKLVKVASDYKLKYFTEDPYFWRKSFAFIEAFLFLVNFALKMVDHGADIRTLGQNGKTLLYPCLSLIFPGMKIISTLHLDQKTEKAKRNKTTIKGCIKTAMKIVSLGVTVNPTDLKENALLSTFLSKDDSEGKRIISSSGFKSEIEELIAELCAGCDEGLIVTGSNDTVLPIKDAVLHILSKSKQDRSDAIIRLLTEHEASPSQKDQQGKTAFEYYLSNYAFNVNAAMEMVRKGADPSTRNEHGKTLLDLLKLQGNKYGGEIEELESWQGNQHSAVSVSYSPK